MSETDKYYQQIEQKLNKAATNEILSTLNEIKQNGKANILPLLFETLLRNDDKEVHDEIFKILGQLKDKESVRYIMEEINSEHSTPYIESLLTTCWQSGLDYSAHIELFAKQFIVGSYQASIEAFTVIEEWIHNSSDETKNRCLELLRQSVADINEQKKPLYVELIKLVESYL